MVNQKTIGDSFSLFTPKSAKLDVLLNCIFLSLHTQFLLQYKSFERMQAERAVIQTDQLQTIGFSSKASSYNNSSNLANFSGYEKT